MFTKPHFLTRWENKCCFRGLCLKVLCNKSPTRQRLRIPGSRTRLPTDLGVLIGIVRALQSRAISRNSLIFFFTTRWFAPKMIKPSPICITHTTDKHYRLYMPPRRAPPNLKTSEQSPESQKWETNVQTNKGSTMHDVSHMQTHLKNTRRPSLPLRNAGLPIFHSCDLGQTVITIASLLGPKVQLGK